MSHTMQMAEAILARKAARGQAVALVHQLAGQAALGAKEYSDADLISAFAELDKISPESPDPDDDIVVATVKKLIHDAVLRQEHLAELIVEEGDHVGVRRALLVEYQSQIEALTARLKAAQAE